MGFPIMSIFALREVMEPMMASKMNSRTPDASSTMMRMFSLWKPWNRSAELVEKPYANRLLESSRRVEVIFPPMSSLFLLWMALISRQSVSLTCRSVGAVVMTIASSWVISHHTAASAAAYVLPDALQDRTATRRCFRRALRISFCFSQGVSPSSCSTNATGLFRVRLPKSCLSVGVCFVVFFLGLEKRGCRLLVLGLGVLGGVNRERGLGVGTWGHLTASSTSSSVDRALVC